MKIRRSMLKDAVSVQTFSGEGAYGPVYASAVTVSCNIDPTRRLVRSANGEEAVSEATLLVHPDDGALFNPDALVTIGGRASHVLSVNTQTFLSSDVFLKVVVA